MVDVIFSNLPALIIVLPIFVALFLAILPTSDNGRWAAWFISFLTSGYILSGCLYIFLRVIYGGPESYSMGGWSPPFGIQYLATRVNSFILLVFSGINFMIIPAAFALVENEIEKKKIPLFYSCYMLCLAGLFGMVITNDIFNIYVFLEISSLATYAMISLGKGRDAVKAAFNYLVIGTIGGTFFLFGIALVYAQTGSLNISDIISFNITGQTSRLTAGALVFMLVGMFIKSAVYPFSNWLPRMYQHAPSYVSAFLAAIATKVALFILLRVVYEIFVANYFASALLLLAILAMLFGSIAACMQTNVKRLLGFSSIANIGYILLGIAMLEETGLTAALYHYIAHSLAVAGIFVVIGIIVLHTGGSDLQHFRGLGKKLPFVMACFTILGLSLVGIPLTPGFVSKWYLINSALSYQSVALQITIISSLAISSLLSALYVWKIIEQVYFRESEESFTEQYFSSFALSLLVIASIFLGLFSSPIIRYLTGIAEVMLSGGHHG